MKLNIKRAVLGICMATCLFSLSACSKADTDAGIDSEIQAQMEQSMPGLLQQFVSIPEAQLEEAHTNALKSQNTVVAEAIDSWRNVMQDLGNFVSIDSVVKIEEIDTGYSATVNAVFEKRGMEFGITVDHNLNEITGFSFSPFYSVGENMEQAFMNMIIGMGTVFAVLIFISLLIGCFKYIRIFEEKMAKKEEKTPEPVVIPEQIAAVEAEMPEENLADDLELVAVITAAIAAGTGISPEGLVVRSIKRAPSSKWKRA